MKIKYLTGGWAAAGTIFWSCFFVAQTAWAGMDHLVISQVQVAGDSADDEFVEIFNPTAATTSLFGWSVQYKTNSGGYPISKANRMDFPQVCLPGGEFLLLGGSAYNSSTVPANLSYNFSLSGNRTGATVFLVSSTSSVASATDPAIADKIGYGTSPENSPEGEAVQFLQELSFDPKWAFFRNADTDNNAADFIIQSSNPRRTASFLCEGESLPEEESPSTTPDGQEDYLTKSQEIKIFRFLPNPAGEDPGNEWVELKNIGSQTVLLDNWLLDDRSEGGGPGADALVLGGLINPGETRRFVLPAMAFALNNSNGDEINLYFADKTLADAAVYAASAPNDGVFELSGGAWQPPAQPSYTSGSGGSSAANTLPVSAEIKITEFMPNPQGADEGREWVELYNSGSATATLSGWKLDDAGSGGPGSGAYALNEAAKIPAQGYLVVTVPPGKFALGNSGSDGVRLFKPDNTLAGSVDYADAPEGLSWSADKKGEWGFGLPTPGADNLSGAPLANISITELLPNPAEDDEEFVELFNAGGITAGLEGFVLRIGERERVLGKLFLAPSTYLALYEDELPVKLRNSGQVVVLLDNFGRELSRVAYPKSVKGQAYAQLRQGEYAWTAKPTPAAVNELVLGESVTLGKNQKTESKPAGSSEAKISADLKKLVKDTQELNRQLDEKVAALESLVLALAEAGQAEPANALAADPGDADADAGSPGRSLYLLVAGLSALSLLLLVRQYFSKKSQR